MFMSIVKDLARGFRILSKYDDDDYIECGVDVIITNFKPEDLSDEDYDEMLELGFEYDDEYDCLIYYT